MDWMFPRFQCSNRLMKQFLFCVLASLPAVAYAQTFTDRIKLNQVGFYPNAPKLAAVTGDVNATSFYITSTNLRDTIFTGNLSPARQSAYSKTTTRLADFSQVKK